MSIVYCQALRVKRICYEEKNFKQYILKMRSRLQKRDYYNKVLGEELVKFTVSLAAKKVNVFRLSSRIIL